jgi:hypothetical protein
VVTLDGGGVCDAVAMVGMVRMVRMWDSKVKLSSSFELGRPGGWYGLMEILYLPAPGR